MFDPLSTPSSSLEGLGPEFRHAPYEIVAELKECDGSVSARAIGHSNIGGSYYFVGDDAMHREPPNAGGGIAGSRPRMRSPDCGQTRT
jgi:hypothetical protein